VIKRATIAWRDANIAKNFRNGVRFNLVRTSKAQPARKVWPQICFPRLLEMWQKRDIPMSHTKAAGVVSQAVTDPLFTARLNCFTSLVKDITPFLVQYQTDRHMLPFLASDLNHMTKGLLYRLTERDIVDGTSSTSLSELSLSGTALIKKTLGSLLMPS